MGREAPDSANSWRIRGSQPLVGCVPRVHAPYIPMAIRIYCSFHVEQDLRRVDQIRDQLRNSKSGQAGFFDPAEYEALMRENKDTIRRRIRERLAGTSVTLVLIGSQTASRPFVQVEIEESIANRNGLLGIHIHGVEDASGEPSFSGPPPIVPPGLEFPCSIWDWDLERLQQAIEAAALRAEHWRAEAELRTRR